MSPIRNFSGRSSRGFPRRQHLLWFFGDDKSHDALMTLPVEGFNGTLRILLPPSSNNNVIRCLGLGQGRCCRRGKEGTVEGVRKVLEKWGLWKPLRLPLVQKFFARVHTKFLTGICHENLSVSTENFHFILVHFHWFFFIVVVVVVFFLHLYFCVDFRSASAKGCGCLGSSQELCGASSSLP